MAQYDEARNQLETRLSQLTNRIGKIEHDLRQVPSPDSEERAVEVENDEVLQHLDETSLDEVRQIREALARLQTGTYAVCTNCGQTIDSARLLAMPTAVTCRVCAS